MSKEAKSADLILKLYDLRREETMRKARNWMFGFNPKSAEDIGNTMMDPEVGAYLRMVLSYWDMAAALVNHGAIDPTMFAETNGEYIGVYAKMQPFIEDLRAQWQMPEAFANLEKVIMSLPDGAERVRRNQEWMKKIQEQMAAAAEAAATAG
jgi:hypothetical protein